MNGVDFEFSDQGSLWLVTPMNEAAREHLEENVAADAQWHGLSLAVEPRYVGDLATGLNDNGFTTSAI